MNKQKRTKKSQVRILPMKVDPEFVLEGIIDLVASGHTDDLAGIVRLIRMYGDLRVEGRKG